MKLSYLLPQNIPQALPLLIRPMLLISLGVHSLVLGLPMVQKSAPPEPPPAKQEKVKITTLVASPSKPSPKLAPQKSTEVPKPKPKQTPKKVKQIPQPDVEPLPPLKPKEEPKEEEPEELQPIDNKTEDKPPVDDKTDDKPPVDDKTDDKPPVDNSEAGAEAGKGLLDELRDRIFRDLVENSTNDPDTVKKDLNSLPALDDIEASLVEYFFEGQNLKEGTIGSLWIAQRRPQTSYDQYIEPVLTTELGFKIAPPESYGEAKLYKAENEQGVKFYMSLVPVASFNSQTLVVIWAKDPRE